MVSSLRISAKERVIVALDVPGHDTALRLVKSLTPKIATFKVGPVLFLDRGYLGIKELMNSGAQIFLDLKFHDIPTTVAKAAERVAAMGVKMFTVHALGGVDMMKMACERVAHEASRMSLPKPLVLAVTVLTSHDEATTRSFGIEGTLKDTVLRLAHLAEKAGVDGIVASGYEVEMLRREFGDRFVLVVPGIRPGGESHDQRRVVTPQMAISQGADYIVVGRAVTQASEPESAIEGIIASIESLP
jgi:orotidine-5'-phosphate decarboxylase